MNAHLRISVQFIRVKFEGRMLMMMMSTAIKHDISMKGVAGIVLLLLSWSVGVTSQSNSSRAVFILGDSLVDSGNNNYLATVARADFSPYGIDSPNRRATGRFSNAMNIADLTCEALGVEPVVPYLNPSIGIPSNLLRGANFASAGVGILNDTGLQFGPFILRMPLQFEYFREYQDRVATIIGRSATNELVANAVVSITLGGNDYVNNYYFLPVTVRSVQFPNVADYNNFIVSEYKKILARLYELGARTIVVAAAGPLGCVPAQRALRTLTGECDATLQSVAVLFNTGVRNIVDELNSQYGATIYTFADTFNMTLNIVNNPGAYGFETAQYACCGQGRFNAIGTCTPVSPVCPNRTAFFWWDEYHPTERANRFIVNFFFNGGTSYMYPVNLRTMLKIND
ncbi:hypothetical protein SUGI_0839510 [Cryptomeria japonica]|uniref:GDSL esterase/lipase LTL1 n=1 Tax=Cryptomeria japonica TaxID=3369 RepID=UPI002414941F|nr:GDSL esterase/lipase LTL1 [Cryptomeria japonica]GLJ40658.1 hypothetical protein SUGI_0839510 [Cryptomeria japonica]